MERPLWGLVDADVSRYRISRLLQPVILRVMKKNGSGLGWKNAAILVPTRLDPAESDDAGIIFSSSTKEGKQS
jgi:hypothetical protein